MVYRGQIKNGVIVLEGSPSLTEGTVVQVEPIEQTTQTLGEKLMELAGIAEGLPSDMAEQHDHYIHGCPKK